MPPQCDVCSPGTSGEGWGEGFSMTYKRFYPGAQGEIGEARKEIRGEAGAGGGTLP
jgi:hypothetical protein